VSLGQKRVTLPDESQSAFRVALSFLLYRAPGLSLQTQPEDSSLPQYDLHADKNQESNRRSESALPRDQESTSGKTVTTRSTSIYVPNHFKRRWASVSKKVARFLVPVRM
jgi:hypothetical protein